MVRGERGRDVRVKEEFICRASDDPVKGVAETMGGLCYVLHKVVM